MRERESVSDHLKRLELPSRLEKKMRSDAGQFEHGRVFGLGRHHTPRQLELGFGPATCLDALAPCQ